MRRALHSLRSLLALRRRLSPSVHRLHRPSDARCAETRARQSPAYREGGGVMSIMSDGNPLIVFFELPHSPDPVPIPVFGKFTKYVDGVHQTTGLEYPLGIEV